MLQDLKTRDGSHGQVKFIPSDFLDAREMVRKSVSGNI
jgi:hypothetical protein